MLKRSAYLFICASLFAAAALVTADDIIEAAKRGDLQAVKAILAEDPAKVKAVDESDFTPLHYAAVGAHWDVFLLLLHSGADINAKSELNSTPTHFACNHDRTDMVKLLIDRGADLRVQNIFGMTPLHTAVWRNCPRVAELLLESGIDTSPASKEGWTALHYAYLSGHKECIDVLLKHGVPADVKDNNGKTPAELYRERPQPVDIELPLQDYVGVYQEVPVWIDNGKLYLREFAVEELYPIAQDTFFCRNAPWKIKFTRDEESRVVGVELHFIRRTMSLRKTE